MNWFTNNLELYLRLAGLAQLILVLGSFFIPKQLGWNKELSSANQLVRQLFWTYGGYILGSHLFFGLVSAFAAPALLESGPLGLALLSFMGLWWSIRIILQFTCFDRTCIPPNRFNVIAESILVLMFFCLSITYLGALWVHHF